MTTPVTLDRYGLVSNDTNEVLNYHLFADGEAPNLHPNKGVRWLKVKREGHEDIDPKKHARIIPEITVHDDHILWKFEVQSFNNAQIAEQRAAKSQLVKAEAARRILNLMPEWKQRNALARMLALQGMNPGPREKWPARASAEYNELLTAWAAVDAIREHSNLIEESIPQDAEGIENFDPTGWE